MAVVVADAPNPGMETQVDSVYRDALYCTELSIIIKEIIHKSFTSLYVDV